jgi:hypothetical protein
VTGWQLEAHANPRELEQKSGEVVFRELLEGPWFRRQLERLGREHHTPLPSDFEFDLSLDRRFRVTVAEVSVGDDPAGAWLRELLLHLPVPVPNFARGYVPKPIRVEGRITTTVAASP